MREIKVPRLFLQLQTQNCIDISHFKNTDDGFWMLYKSLSDLLAAKNIFDVPDSCGELLSCDRFFDDWFLYAVPDDRDYTYSLLKLREQESDATDCTPADGDTPGVTISFISFNYQMLLDCLENPSDENRKMLNDEINRVVAYKGQRHHKALKRYFKNPLSQAPYLIAKTYVTYIASYAENGYLTVPEYYKDIVQQSNSYKSSKKLARLPRFIESLNQEAGQIICDNEKIYINNRKNPNEHECLAILATHTGNVSIFSFAAEVEYHARFLISLAKIKIPFFGKSIYDSAIRADMTVGDTEFEGPAPFYRSDSKIVKRQYDLHKKEKFYD